MHAADARTLPPLRHPIHPVLLCFPMACLVGALLTDLVYWRTAEMMWADFSAWLVSAGAILTWLAAIGGIVDLVGRRYAAVAPVSWTWIYVVANIVIIVLATLNMFVHTRDAWTSVVPWGLTLSIATFLVLAITAWIGWVGLYRHDRTRLA